MNENFNWSKYFELYKQFDHNSTHLLLNWKQNEFNFNKNVKLNRKQQLKDYSKNEQHNITTQYYYKFKKLNYLSLIEFIKNSNYQLMKIKTNKMTNSNNVNFVNINNKLIKKSKIKLLNFNKMYFYKIEYLLFILIYLIQFINCIQLPINPSNNYLNSNQPTKSTPLQFINTIKLNKRFTDDIYNKNNDNDLSLSSTENNELSKLNNYVILDNNLNLNNLTINSDLNNQTKLIDELEQQKNRQEIQFKEEQEKIINEIELINSGTVCNQLNKQTNFKTKGNKDSSKENRDKNYWILVKALEPKSIKMPILNNQILPSHEIKEYYHELIEKLKLITSILYDNDKQDQTNQQQHNLLMKKIIREIGYLHPHVLKARLITLDLNKDKQRKRRDLTSFNYQDNNNNFQEYLDHDDLNDEQSNLDNLEQNDNLQNNNLQTKQNTVPFRRISRQSSDRLIASTDNLDQKTINEQWLFAKNILFYIRGEPVYEFNDITLTTKKEHVSWLDIKEVDETSGTINEFDQLLAKGHLFVMSEKERLFSGFTGIYFDCATRKWLLSYTNLLVSCNQCTNKKQSESLVDNELEMRLIGLLSVDIDLVSVDINQCESLSNEIESSLDKINEFNNVPQVKSFTQPTISMQQTNQLNLNSQESDINSLLNENINTFLNQNNSQLVKLNDRSINQPQRLVSSSIFSNSIVNYNNSLKMHKSNINKFGNRLILHFDKTNKCHKETSECHFVPNKGIRKGLGYICKCKPGYYALLSKFQGKEIEHAYENQNLQKNIAPDNKPYDRMYICKKCSIGCDTCVDSSPCLSSYNWAFRVSLLIISCLCICLIFVLSYYIYKYRKIKVFKVASPVFLTLTLLGCSIMYAEMIMIFPILNRFWCILTKITRHMGFCITYSALLLKTWRVSLTYRVKSAHKLKLTDRQLLQWLFPILLVMTIFLATWIISDPPREVIITDWNKLKFTICEYNWFDHSLAIGEFLFLLWGIKVCYNVRNAESFFNEARYITYAIYNIAAVNILMILIHLIILPNAGPDEKYFLGFVRTQLSTTTTILLIFGPKFYRLIKGEGDDLKIRARRGINASFSLNGVGVVHEELTDLYQENEELKEQVHKLATQVELMRLRQMQINNRHLKSKHIGSTASSQAVNSSVVVNSANVTAGLLANTGPHFHSYSYNQLNPQVDSAGIGLVTGLVGGVVGAQPVLTPALALNAFTQPATDKYATQRVSAAAELQSEKV